MGIERQHDLYFKHPCRDFSITDEAIRLRFVDGKIFLTYKGKRIDKETKTREEVETEVGNNMDKILIKLGFERFIEINKIRKKYSLKNVVISLDSVEGLGNFIEMETHGDYGKGKDELMELADKLSLKSLERRSYLEMMVDGYEKF